MKRSDAVRVGNISVHALSLVKSKWRKDHDQILSEGLVKILRGFRKDSSGDVYPTLCFITME